MPRKRTRRPRMSDRLDEAVGQGLDPTALPDEESSERVRESHDRSVPIARPLPALEFERLKRNAERRRTSRVISQEDKSE